jgi:hypothetical protein
VENEEWSLRGIWYSVQCKNWQGTDGSIHDVIFVGENSARDSNSITFGMSRVSLCILIMAVVLIIVSPLHRIFESLRNSFYCCVGHTTTWLNGLKRWVT